MNSVVLGGCGFSGSRVVDALRADGHAVTVFDRAMERYRDPVPGVEYILGDFSDKMALAEALNGKDTVFQLVSTTFPGTASLDPKAAVTGQRIEPVFKPGRGIDVPYSVLDIGRVADGGFL